MSIEIRPVGAGPGTASVDDFLDVLWRVYADDPAWVPPLRFERRDFLGDDNPWLDHGRWQGWLALRDGQPVGRLTAQVDDLHAEYHEPGTGYFGHVDILDDEAAFEALFETAAAWLREQGMTTIEGPYSFGINNEVGLLVDGFDTSPVFLMGHARRWADGHLARLGFEAAVDLLAYTVRTDFETPRVMSSALKWLEGRATVRPLDKSDVDGELEKMRDVFNDAWADNWGFVPFTEREFRTIGREMLMLISPDLIQIAEVDGEPAAFIVLLPNVNEAISDLDGRLLPFGWAKALWRLKVRGVTTARVPLMGVRRRYHRSRMATALAFRVIESVRVAARAQGIVDVELSWILESNRGMRSIIEAIGGDAYKTYRMYRKSL